MYVCDMKKWFIGEELMRDTVGDEEKGDTVEGSENRGMDAERKKRGADEIDENPRDQREAVMFLCECKYRSAAVGNSMMTKIIDGLERAWKDKWALAFVFCPNLAAIDERTWKHESIGCVKIDCTEACATWIFTPKDRKKLVIVMVTGEVE